MQARIKRLRLENFKGVKNATYQFDGKNVSVIGQNATGKTTIADSLWWLLFNKDSAGNEKFSIRPLDSAGNQIDNVEICVSAVLDIDGEEMELKKVQKQNWVKKRGTSEIAMQGNVNSYEVDGYPKSEKEYKECVAGISEEELFKILTNPFYLPSLKLNEQRNRIIVLADDIPDVEVASQNERFAGLLPDLEKAKSTDNIKKKYQKALNDWKKKQAELPVRIDEKQKEKQKNLEKLNGLTEEDLQRKMEQTEKQIANNKVKQEDISKEFEEQQKASDGILELKFELNDLQRKANGELDNKRRELREKINDICQEIKELNKQIGLNDRDIGILEEYIRKHTEEIEKCCDDWNRISGEEMREESVVCPTCHREMPEDFRKKYVSEFEKSKKDRLALVSQKGNEMKDRIKQDNAEIEQIKVTKAENENEKEKKEEELSALEKELDNIPQSIDISDRPEVQEIQRQIAEKEQAMNKGNSAEEIRRQLKAEGEELQKQMDEVKEQFVLVKISNEADERIAELQAEQREVSQKVADQEKMIDLLEEFIRFKMDRVSDTINQKLDGVCVKLFENQINGGMKECCELTYGGVPYGSLNNGHRIVAGLKIIKTLQEFYGIYAPVFIDNAESINDFNLPEMDCQMIFLSVPVLTRWQRARMTEEEVNEFYDYYKELKIEVEG